MTKKGDETIANFYDYPPDFFNLIIIDGKQQEFLDFVLDCYVRDGLGELDRRKLPQLLKSKYHNTHDAIAILGNIQTINKIFTSFQPHLDSDSKSG